MLRGMGWEEGKPVGRNNNGMVAAVEFVPPVGRGSGLARIGAQQAGEHQEEYIKPGESREAPATMVLAKGPEGQSRNVKTLDEKLVGGARRREKGKRMCVVEGRHRGLTGRVLKVVKQEGRSDRARLELDTSGEVVTIRTGELADLGTRDADRAMRKEG